MNSFADFLLNEGLYRRKEISADNIGDLIEIIQGNVKIDCYCPECKENRVFTMRPIPYYWDDEHGFHKEYLCEMLKNIQMLNELYIPAPGTISTDKDSEWIWSNPLIRDATRVLSFQFNCSFEEQHHLEYIVSVNNNEIIKIGQYPSVADLSLPELKQYDKVTAKADMKEFRRAIGLSAQGIGIGSFVYLRRIIERLIEAAKGTAIKDGVIVEADYSQLRVGERIDLLKNYLPDFLVGNKVLYGIISKGIHELSEEECQEYFPILQDCILLILDEWEELRKKEARSRKLSSELSKISSK